MGSRLESIVLPSTLRIIEAELFYGLESLKSVEFGEDSQLEKIKAWTFYNCGLESFIAPASLKKIGKNAFMDCLALKHVDLSACTFLSDDNPMFGDAFDISRLESIVLPSTLKVIRD